MAKIPSEAVSILQTIVFLKVTVWDLSNRIELLIGSDVDTSSHEVSSLCCFCKDATDAFSIPEKDLLDAFGIR